MGLEREVEEEEAAKMRSLCGGEDRGRVLRRKRAEEGGGGLSQVIREVRCWK